jgi:branched-chain amino acid transport system permease protein
VVDYLISVATLVTIYSMVSLALNVRWGWAGLFDFFVYALVAVGAYVHGVVTLPPAPPNQYGDQYILGLHLPFVVGVLAAMAVTGFISLVVGAIALRQLRQLYFGIMTFSAVLVLAVVIMAEPELFNGVIGLYGVEQPLSGIVTDPTAYSLLFLVLCVGVLAVVYVVLERLFWSPFGLCLRSIRDDEVAATAFGRDIFTERLKAYVIGGLIAGLAGALLMTYLTSFSPGGWSPIETILIFTAIILGGTANNLGVIIGTVVVFGVIGEGSRFLPDIPGHSDAFAALRIIAVAVLTVVVLRWRPQGLLPEPHLRDAAKSSLDAKTSTKRT